VSFVGIEPPYVSCYSSESVPIVAKRQEAHGTRRSHARDMDCRPNVLHHNGINLDGHRQWSLSSMDRSSQPGCDEYDTDKWNYCLLSAAAGTDAFLLFSHRLQTMYEGNNWQHFVMVGYLAKFNKYSHRVRTASEKLQTSNKVGLQGSPYLTYLYTSLTFERQCCFLKRTMR